jgi:hypothetical protein
MRNLIRSVALLTVLGSKVAIAQTTGNATSSVGAGSPAAPSSLTRDTRSIARDHGRTSEAPPDERGGNRYVRT